MKKSLNNNCHLNFDMTNDLQDVPAACGGVHFSFAACFKLYAL